MYSDNQYSGDGYQSRGQRPYNSYRGRGGGGFNNNRYYEGGDPPPHNGVQEYRPRVYRGPSRGGNYYGRGGGGRRPQTPYRGGWGGDFHGNSSGFYRNDRGRYPRGGQYQPQHNRRGNYDNYQGQQQSYPRREQGGRFQGYRGRNYQPRGRQPQRWERETMPPPYANPPDSFHQGADDELPAGLSWCCDLQGHSSSVNCLDFDEDSGKLFSGGADGIVRQWNAETGQVEHSASYNGEITMVLVENHFLFLAVHCTQDEAGNQGIQSGDIHVYNLEAQSEQKFMAHMGRVFALRVAGDILFSAGEDRVIKGWKFNPETKLFNAAGSFGPTHGGHTAPIQCMTTLSIFLFSGDASGAILIWNMETGTLLQSLHHGHNASVSSMLCWKGSLITGSLDQTISVWNLDLAQSACNVVQTPPCYHSEAKNARGFPCEVISLCGTPDGGNNPVLMAGLSTNEIVLYDLPSFALRGRIKDVPYPKGLSAAANSCLFIGQGNGSVRVFVWDEDPADEAAMVT